MTLKENNQLNYDKNKALTAYCMMCIRISEVPKEELVILINNCSKSKALLVVINKCNETNL